MRREGPGQHNDTPAYAGAAVRSKPRAVTRDRHPCHRHDERAASPFGYGGRRYPGDTHATRSSSWPGRGALRRGRYRPSEAPPCADGESSRQPSRSAARRSKVATVSHFARCAAAAIIASGKSARWSAACGGAAAEAAGASAHAARSRQPARASEPGALARGRVARGGNGLVEIGEDHGVPLAEPSSDLRQIAADRPDLDLSRPGHVSGEDDDGDP